MWGARLALAEVWRVGHLFRSFGEPVPLDKVPQPQASSINGCYKATYRVTMENAGQRTGALRGAVTGLQLP
jgi:hypothetical protein